MALVRVLSALCHLVDQARYDAFQLVVEESLCFGRFDTQD